MRSRGVVPLGLVFNSVNPILAQGAAFAGLPMLAGFASDITTLVRSGELVRLHPASSMLEVVPIGQASSSPP
jgi:predicted aconitase with swiveling domain